jgi:MFS family permease
MIAILAAILAPYFIAGFVDFWMKERTKRRLYREGKGWADMPAYLLHEHGWHWYITGIWIVLLIVQVVVLGGPWQILLGALLFYTEDLAYYIFTRIAYGGTEERKFLPPRLPWLHGNITAYRRLVGDDYPRRKFLIVYAGQWIAFAILFLAFQP